MKITNLVIVFHFFFKDLPKKIRKEEIAERECVTAGFLLRCQRRCVLIGPSLLNNEVDCGRNHFRCFFFVLFFFFAQKIIIAII